MLSKVDDTGSSSSTRKTEQQQQQRSSLPSSSTVLGIRSKKKFKKQKQSKNKTNVSANVVRLKKMSQLLKIAKGPDGTKGFYSRHQTLNPSAKSFTPK